jgi:hypothetical protein
MLHITCIAHGLHNLCEEIRDLFDDVNDFIAKTKALFVKCPSRIQLFRDLAPGVPVPPSPVVTRWGSWIEAAHYYQKHLNKIIEVQQICIIVKYSLPRHTDFILSFLPYFS